MSRGAAPQGSTTEPRSPLLGGGRGAGTVIAIDWGCLNASKRPKPHVAAVKASETKTVKFRHARELVEEVEPPAKVFAEASGPYLELCQLHNAYGEGNIFCVDTKLVAEYRRASNIPKSDENDAKIILAIAEDYLAGSSPQASGLSSRTS